MFKKLKSLFVVEEEVSDIEKQLENAVQKKQAVSKDQKTPESKAASVNPTVEIFDSNIKGPAKPNKKFTTILLKAIESQNLDGPDYLEFKSSLKSLEGVIEEEDTRYKSSFAVLSSNGDINKDKLLSTGQHYIQVLQKEKAKFEQTFQAQQNKQIQGRQDKIKKYQQGIEKRKQQLKTLITEIEGMEAKLDEAKVEINQAAGKVQLTKDQFMASYQMIVEQIQSDFEKIKEYL